MKFVQKPLYLVLKVLSGPDAGRLVEVMAGQIVYLGRQPSMQKTAAAPAGPLEVSDEQADRVEQFLAGQSGKTESRPGYRPKLDTFRRLDDVKLFDSTVSRVHAVVYVEGGRAGVVDLASTNGTAVNGRKVSSASIKPGDQLQLGNLKIEVVGLG